ncbi:hypothetical protein [Caulobacter phage KcrB]|nr:hypothetical protein RW_GP060 [Caulobacter phage RW]WCA46364.1 hypothetical protein [Caulobacter phage KcrB]WCD56299.1 hypothetical protein [Caulobacter phage RLK]WNV48091.1 hypothetical protein GB2A_gp059 [Caulobacter phage GB2A]
MLAMTCPRCAAKDRKIAELEALLEGAVYFTKKDSARLVYALGVSEQQAELLVALARSGRDFVDKDALIDALPPRYGERRAERPDNQIRIQVSRIRKKLGTDSIRNAFAQGYALSPELKARVVEIMRGE